MFQRLFNFVRDNTLLVAILAIPASYAIELVIWFVCKVTRKEYTGKPWEDTMRIVAWILAMEAGIVIAQLAPGGRWHEVVTRGFNGAMDLILGTGQGGTEPEKPLILQGGFLIRMLWHERLPQLRWPFRFFHRRRQR